MYLFNVIICTYGLSMLSWAHICVVVAYAYFYQLMVQACYPGYTPQYCGLSNEDLVVFVVSESEKRV